ncbi:MAG: phosphoribosylformylglycinamidine synthase [Desulfuromonas sp.]|uniref:phosphoribosylformylglycinamidine synthase subunit PurQ n=1 Tax=Desulfuromonas sp. TaxID=892 RepID=UPI000CBA138D|nr:phosphoribosylformylglycinamidine synthase subunit PurQ [Desulfuromonas sp.]PLX84766.1 MAG: phosphoribosylformylglycinamidine synthase [Desulfuromonas sp.]
MSKQVRAIVIAGNGTNCEREVAHACRIAGADVADIVHIAELLAGRARLDDYHFLNLAGGFLDGDDLGSAKAGANRLLNAPVKGGGHLIDQVRRFIEAGKLVMGVCNGFQLMVKMGLLPALDGDYRRQSATLTFNDGGRFEDRWTYLKADSASPCIYTRGLEGIYLPVRHGEGKFVAESPQALERIETGHLAPLKYSDPGYEGPTMEYPFNPNGSQNAIAGVCDESGRLFGLMPHPEAYVHRTHHPRWTREEDLPEEGMGLWLYQNAVRFIREELL